MPAGQGDVLLLIHEETLRRTSLRVLEELGYTVTPVNDGASALRLMEQGFCFDLALIDADLPVLDGFTTSELLKRQRDDLAIIICANPGQSGIDAAKQAGLPILLKPFGMAQMALLVRDTLEKAA